MNKEEKNDKYFMEHAKLASSMSYCKRAQVGAVIIKDERVISEGRNGTISGSDNCCEEETEGICPECKGEGYFETPGVMSFDCEFCNGTGKRHISKNTVVHAEANAITFAAKHGTKIDGCKIYQTLSPCIECAKLIIQSGIKEVIYLDTYRDTKGIEFLKEHNIKIRKL